MSFFPIVALFSAGLYPAGEPPLQARQNKGAHAPVLTEVTGSPSPDFEPACPDARPAY
jgi:hypothetical protein